MSKAAVVHVDQMRGLVELARREAIFEPICVNATDRAAQLTVEGREDWRHLINIERRFK